MDIEKIVTSRFAALTKLPQDSIDLNANVIDKYGFTSILAVKLLSDVEAELDIDIDQQEALGLHTLNDVIKLVKAKLG